MTITLIEEAGMSTIALPEKPSGRYGLYARNRTEIAYVDGIQGQWQLHAGNGIQFVGKPNENARTLTLANQLQIISLQMDGQARTMQLFVEPATENRQTYKKYCVTEDCRINIGRALDNQIIFDNPYVSSHHACLVWQNRRWTLSDMQSRNGTFVNEQRIHTRELVFGDVVCIMGLKIVPGLGFFSINNPDGKVTFAAGSAMTLAMPQPEEYTSATPAPPKTPDFTRSPRIMRGIAQSSLQVFAPPQRNKPEETPLALMLGPALTMGLSAVMMGSIAAINLENGTASLLTALPTLAMSFSMLCGTILWPLLTRRHEKKKNDAMEEKRQRRYREYLDEVRGKIYAMQAEQKTILLENCPAPEECACRAQTQAQTLWERTPVQSDFLQIRLGIGQVPFHGEIKFPSEAFSPEGDTLQNDLQRLAALPRVLTDAPVTCSLTKNPVVGLAGRSEDARALLQSLVLQLAVLHSPQEMHLAFFLSEEERESWAQFRLLPHLWDQDRTIRWFAASEKDWRALALHLERRFGQLDGTETSAFGCCVLVIPNAAKMTETSPAAKLLSHAGKTGIFALTAAENLSLLPRECSMIVQLDEENARLYDQNNPAGEMSLFRWEKPEPARLFAALDALANIELAVTEENTSLPKMLTFLEMYGVGRTEHLNALTRWQDSDPIHSLQAQIGVRQDGSPFYLDLHEQAHGPHGLIAGMTGSGKSELIITFILSMALNYHPEEVAFILIDYKGGGLTGAFEDPISGVRLPHLAGTITNLDGGTVIRALISIQSELRRRQMVFNEARQVSGEGTMDIYKYQKLCRDGVVHEPIPHLFIVADEFAELKAQQPEFMAQLISAARIGRSLGVHLILATQKPSGVVNDQIWSNSRFRICLKVQERADSMEMFKRPDAAELRETGRFYLQVGFNELFELGQSGWCGAPYYPAETVQAKTGDSVAVVDEMGRVIAETKRRTNTEQSQGSQIVSIVHYLSELGRDERVSARQLWLPQISAQLELDPLAEKYGWCPRPYILEPILGEFDDPFNQRQGLLTLPLTQKGNALIYGMTGSGKTMLLNTLLVGLLRAHTAAQLNIYLVDMGEEALQAFADAPQVGDVVLSTDGEKLRELFKLLTGEIASRKKLFASLGGDFPAACRSAKKDLPQILVVIHNYAAFAEQYELLDEQLIRLTRDSSKYGVYFLLTANAPNMVRYRLAQNFANVYTLQLNDRSDYAGIFGGTDGVYPANIKGRGLCKTSRVYEFQTAQISAAGSPEGLRAITRQLASQSAEHARPVPSLPKQVTADMFSQLAANALPLGIEKETLRPAVWNLERHPLTLLLGRDQEALAVCTQGLCELLLRVPGRLTVLDGGDFLESPDFPCEKRAFSEPVNRLFEEMVQRNHLCKEAADKDTKAGPWPAEYCLLTGIGAVRESLDKDTLDKLDTMLLKVRPEYGIRFVLCNTDGAMEKLRQLPWYQQQINETTGVWVGSGITNQYILRLVNPSSNLHSDLPPQFGYLVSRGKPVLAKLIVGSANKEEE